MVFVLHVAKDAIGQGHKVNEVILGGICSFCEQAVTFRQIGTYTVINGNEQVVAVKCEGCNALQIFSVSKSKMYPRSSISGIKSLPPEIEKYYEEALRCLSADCPNGAMTLFASAPVTPGMVSSWSRVATLRS